MARLESFELDGVKFVLDLRDGKDRGTSRDDEFVLVKPQSFIDLYRELQRYKPKNVLEVGMFEGGSLVLFDKLFVPQKLVGLDLRKEPIRPLENYREERPHIKTFYGLSQNDPELRSILGREFPEGIDLVVDDASHHYKMSRATFHSCFPLVNPGGLYVIEDWSWSHQPGAQTDAHPWFKRPALTNLLMDLVVSLPDSPHLEKVTIHQDIVVVEKSFTPPKTDIDLDRGHGRLRSRSLGSI